MTDEQFIEDLSNRVYSLADKYYADPSAPIKVRVVNGGHHGLLPPDRYRDCLAQAAEELAASRCEYRIVGVAGGGKARFIITRIL